MDDTPEYHEMQDITADGKSGPYNESEIKITASLLKKLRENFSERIAVITPYKNQNKKLRQRLRDECLENVVVNTIDAFQGDEADVVIYCTTRAITPTKYFSDAARLNVAFSRAKNLLIIIGALNYFHRYKSGHLMQTIADYLEARGRVVNVTDFFSDEFQFSFNALPTAENFHAEDNETPLTASEIESYLPAREDDSRLTCRSCGGKFESNELLEGFCPNCLFDGEHYKCGNCGANMLYTNAAQYVYHQLKEELCEDCKIIWRHTCKRCGVNEVVVRARDLKNNPQKTENDFPYCRNCLNERNKRILITCAACRKEFFISRGLAEDLQAQGKTPSKYCQDCWNEKISVGSCRNCGRPILYSRAKLHQLREKYGLNYLPPRKCEKCKKM